MSHPLEYPASTAAPSHLDAILPTRTTSPASPPPDLSPFLPTLLDQARRFHIPPADRTTVVQTFLNDLSLKLQHSPPRSLPAFVSRAFRNHAIDLYRRRKHAERTIEAHADLIAGERVIAASCSTYTLSATLGPSSAESSSSLSTALQDLATHLLHNRTADERTLLTWMSQRVPLRDVAEWMQLSYTATKVRAHRLRTKLITETDAYVSGVNEPHRSELRRFLRRAGHPLAQLPRETGEATRRRRHSYILPECRVAILQEFNKHSTNSSSAMAEH